MMERWAHRTTLATSRAGIDAALFEPGYSITPPPSRAPPAAVGQMMLLFD